MARGRRLPAPSWPMELGLVWRGTGWRFGGARPDALVSRPARSSGALGPRRYSPPLPFRGAPIWAAGFARGPHPD